MPVCKKIRTKNQRVCTGDLKWRVILQNRNIKPPAFGSVDFDETFTTSQTVWAAIETKTGDTLFDGVDTDNKVTHVFYIRFKATVTSETWISFDGRRFDILNVESLDERKKYLKLTCIDRGLDTEEAAKA